MKKYMVDTGIWRIPLANIKKQLFREETLWHSIIMLVKKSKVSLLYNNIIEKEILNDQKTFFIKNGEIVEEGTESARKVVIVKAKSESAIHDLKEYGKKVESSLKLCDDLEKIIKTIDGGPEDKQILRDAISNDCNGIMTLNKKHFVSSRLLEIGFEIIDLKDYHDSFKGAELLNRIQN